MKILIIFLGCVIFTATLLAWVAGGKETLLWLFDRVRGYEQSHLMFEDDRIEVSFSQRAHGDYYYSFFKVKNSEGSIREFEIDGDDARWFDVEVRAVGNRYIVSGDSPWRGLRLESHYDAETGELYTGFNSRTIAIQ